jgi:hypothetical protein
MAEPSSPEYRAFLRLRSARAHLDLTIRGTSAAIEEPLRNLAAACRATAFLEGDEARVEELASVAERLLEAIDEIAALTARAYATTRHDWPPASDAGLLP